MTVNAMRGQRREVADYYLKSLRSTLWGQAFDIIVNGTDAAVDFIVKLQEDLDAAEWKMKIDAEYQGQR